LFTEAEKQAQVAKITWEQKIMEKESEKRIAEIEGLYHQFDSFPSVIFITCVCSEVIHCFLLMF
jgi:hypothetical protein